MDGKEIVISTIVIEIFITIVYLAFVFLYCN